MFRKGRGRREEGKNNRRRLGLVKDKEEEKREKITIGEERYD